MFRVPVPTNQESRSQGSEERRIIVGRYGGARGDSRWRISSMAMDERQAGWLQPGFCQTDNVGVLDDVWNYGV